MFILLLRYICGYLSIKIYGDYPERFINICAANGISLWNIRRRGDCIYANIDVRNYKEIRVLKRKSRVKLKIVRKKGLYFIIKPYLKRSGLAVGVVLFFLLNIALSSFIWNIEIKGNKSLSDEEIIFMCSDIGIYEGMLSSNIDTNDARLKLLIGNEKLSWASFIIEGSHLTVNVSETESVTEDDKSPANFIAARDGIIEKIEISSGQAVVKKGQAVVAGELLASGTVEYKDQSTHFTRCSGTVTARTKRELSVTVPYEIVKKEYTGKSSEKKVVSFFGLKFPLDLVPVTYEHEKEVEKNFFGNEESYLPIYVYNVEFRETSKRNIKMNKKDARKYALNKLKEKEAKELKNAQIIDYEDKITFTDSVITIKRCYNCIENIEILENIKINIVN